jgi:general secretion pathway protein J
MRRLPEQPKGFTLLELLVAVAIFAMLGIGSYRLLATTIATRDAARTHDTDLIRLQKIFTVLNRDIAQAIEEAPSFEELAEAPHAAEIVDEALAL